MAATPRYLPCLLAAALAGTCQGGEPATLAPAQTIDCAGNALALSEADPVIQHRDGDELHQYWLLVDHPDLWGTTTPPLEALTRYRQQASAIVPDTAPLALIRTNRERHPWLELEYPAEGRINRLVEAGAGTHRPMNCLESQIPDYQAARFPLYEQPSEIVALIVKRTEATGDRVKVYIAADNDSSLPKASHALTAIELDVAEGWSFYGVFHNHTFNHSADRGHLPVAAPSSSDLQVSVAVHERLGLEWVLVTDGFSTAVTCPAPRPIAFA